MLGRLALFLVTVALLTDVLSAQPVHPAARELKAAAAATGLVQKQRRGKPQPFGVESRKSRGQMSLIAEGSGLKSSISGAKKKTKRANHMPGTKKLAHSVARIAQNNATLKAPSSIKSSRSHFKSFISVGVFGDLRKFFEELRSSLAHGDTKGDLSYDDISAESFNSLLDQGGLSDDSPTFQALRMNPESNRPQANLRRFVSNTDPIRGAMKYNPDLLWTGLGR